MKRVYIPCEFNPFHYGHKYLTDTLKERGFTQIAGGMSGPFVQRGQCAIFDRKIRAAAAVNAGVNLIIQLPHIYSCANAELFARGHVRLALLTGSDCFAFGTQDIQEDKLERAADIILKGEAEKAIAEKIKVNIPYPAARIAALEELTGWDYGFLKKSNNILALEYLIAIRKFAPSLSPLAVPRRAFPSASEIREEYLAGRDISSMLPLEYYEGRLPAPRSLEEYSMIFKAMLLLKPAEAVADTADLPRGLGDRLIAKAGILSEGLERFAEGVSGKTTTKSRVRRSLINCALNVTKEDIRYFKENPPDYIRLLAADDTGRKMLNDIKENNLANIITKLPDVIKKLTEPSLRAVKIDAAAQNLWDLFEMRVNEDYRYTPYIKGTAYDLK
ncbi:MAG: nucleotidyltransferase family protein [Eubacteriaceae bacterium]|nr:nucleotidyltransferase family protein [Eubacteriaceae bacterium]